MQNFLNNMANNPLCKILAIILILDVFLGSLRAIKEHKWNSTVGINGMLRKFGMIGSIICLALVDSCINLDLLFFVPDEVLNFINLQRVGSCELFSIMFILYELTSVLKNMVLCGMPIPKKMKIKIEELLENMTSELDNKKINKKEE